MSQEIKAIEDWLKKKELPRVLGGNYRTIGACVLLKYIKNNYTLTKKVK